METETKAKTIEDKANDILEYAKLVGLDQNCIFETIFHLLITQIKMLNELEKSFNEQGATITKEYVKGRKNIYCHPAIEKYSKLSDSAMNKIVKLEQIIQQDKEKLKNYDSDDFDNFDKF